MEKALILHPHRYTFRLGPRYGSFMRLSGRDYQSYALSKLATECLLYYNECNEGADAVSA